MTKSANPAADTGLPSVTVRRPRKPTKAQINAFMCKLLDPLPDAEIEDKEIDKLTRRAERDQRQRDDDAWVRGALAVRIAKSVVEMFMEAGCAFRRFPLHFPLPDNAEHERAVGAYLAEIDRQFRIPARNVREFRWKEDHLVVTMNVRGYNTDERKKLFAADQERLGLSLRKKR